MIEVPVLVVGGGPVGLAFSLELSHYGIQSMVAERNPTTTTHPKMDLTNGRSTELFRRINLADKLRAAGVPAENPFNISWITDLSENGHELCRFPYFSAADEYWRRRTHNNGSLTLEPPLRVSQIVIEPVLKKAADENGNVDVRFSWRLESFTQDADGVTSIIRNNQIGIARHYQTGKGVIVAQDDKEYWTLHVFLALGTDELKLDLRTLVEEWVGCKFDFEVVIANPWSAHYLVAKEYSKGRVFMAGDACHQFMPTGGYGMNTGIAEVSNLGWKLAAVLNGWGGSALLDSYHNERRPIAKIAWATSESHLNIRFKLAEIYAEAGDVSGSHRRRRHVASHLGNKCRSEQYRKRRLGHGARLPI